MFFHSHTKDNNSSFCGKWCCRGGGFGWGTFFILIGLFLLAREMGWIAIQVSFWPVFLIALGVYFIIRRI